MRSGTFPSHFTEAERRLAEAFVKILERRYPGVRWRLNKADVAERRGATRA